jgi:NhaP-type Na+/H+ or K+/H+ antiporter
MKKNLKNLIDQILQVLSLLLFMLVGGWIQTVTPRYFALTALLVALVVVLMSRDKETVL